MLSKRFDGKTVYADLVWKDRLLLEMKSRGENLHRHFIQIRNYWFDIHPKPRYTILCNFDEFWIYDFLVQNEPLDIVKTKELILHYDALNFLSPKNVKPKFNNNQEEISRKAATKVTELYKSLVERGINELKAQHFVLQCTFAMFAEDSGLLPKDLFTQLVSDCKGGAYSYDLLGALFRQMANKEKAKGGRFKGVDYFNGGLFGNQELIDLNQAEIELLLDSAYRDWSKIHPSIFGAIFESSMNPKQRHAQGAHYTREADIMRIVGPTIVDPFASEINKTKTLKDLLRVRHRLEKFKVLDPACGCGNFLHVAYIELKHLETLLLQKVHDNFGYKTAAKVGISSRIKLSQFYGIDINPLAVELAKISLLIAKVQSVNNAPQISIKQFHPMELDFERTLPLDNLDNNIKCDDSLFCSWPTVHAIISNPPFLASRNKRRTT